MMGEASVREDSTVTRSAEVTPGTFRYTKYFCFRCTNQSACIQYVASFPVDDQCLDDQMEQLHTQLKSLKVSRGSPEVSEEM